MDGRGLSEADEDSIRAQIEKYRRAALEGEWDAWGATLSEDVVASPGNIAPLIGRAAAVAWGEAFPPLEKFMVEIEEIDGEGDVAYARGRYELGMSAPDGTHIGDRGAWLQIHRRSADGTWPYTHMFFHSTEPPPTAP